MLKINPNVTSIVNCSGAIINYFSFSSFFSGLSGVVSSVEHVFAEYD